MSLVRGIVVMRVLSVGLKWLGADNGLRLCVCLPLAQGFKLPQMLMGQIAQNRCYRLLRIINNKSNLKQ